MDDGDLPSFAGRRPGKPTTYGSRKKYASVVPPPPGPKPVKTEEEKQADAEAKAKAEEEAAGAAKVAAAAARAQAAKAAKSRKSGKAAQSGKSSKAVTAVTPASEARSKRKSASDTSSTMGGRDDSPLSEAPSPPPAPSTPASRTMASSPPLSPAPMVSPVKDKATKRVGSPLKAGVTASELSMSTSSASAPAMGRSESPLSEMSDMEMIVASPVKPSPTPKAKSKAKPKPVTSATIPQKRPRKSDSGPSVPKGKTQAAVFRKELSPISQWDQPASSGSTSRTLVDGIIDPSSSGAGSSTTMVSYDLAGVDEIVCAEFGYGDNDDDDDEADEFGIDEMRIGGLAMREEKVREEKERLAKRRKMMKKKGRRSGAGSSSAGSTPGDEPPEEEELFIPTVLPIGASSEEGERSAALIRSRDKWWPAYLTGFQPAQDFTERAKRGDKYGVICRDHPKITHVYSKNFMFLEDPNVATCALGRSTEVEPIFASTARVRDATPEPDAEAKDTIAFVDLPTDEQLRRIRPYLLQVIREQCPPAQERNDLYYLPRNAGREKLMESKNTGDVSDSEATDMFIPELERWALRADRWIGFPEDETRKPEVERPRGSDRYEALRPAQRATYVRLVLLPEAIIAMSILVQHSDDPSPKLHFSAADPPPTEEVYKAAQEDIEDRSRLDAMWRVHTDLLRSYRKISREKQGLRPENDEEEGRAWDLKNGVMEPEVKKTWAGRVSRPPSRLR